MRRCVLFVGDGNSVHMRRLATAVADAGWDVHLACFEGPELLGVTRHLLGNRPPSDDLRYGTAIPRLARIIRRLRPGIVNAHYVTSYGVLARAALALAQPRGGSARLVITAWGSDLLVTPTASRALAALIGWALRGSDLITGDSEDLRERASQLAPGIEWATFIFGPERRLIEAPRNPADIIVSARALLADMRIDLIISAFRAAKAGRPRELEGYRMVIAGEGDRLGELQALAEGLDVDFTGMLERSVLHDLLLRSRIQVAVPRSDATSAALLDGLAAGLIPVVNDLPANRQWVDPSIGELVPIDPTVAELANAIADAASRETDTAEIRERVRPAVWEEQVAQLIERFDALS